MDARGRQGLRGGLDTLPVSGFNGRITVRANEPMHPRTVSAETVEDFQQMERGTRQRCLEGISQRDIERLRAQRTLRETLSCGRRPARLHAMSSGMADARRLMPRIRYRLRDVKDCLLYTSPSPRDRQKSRMPSSA